MTDYWLSKLFYDLVHDPALAAEYREAQEPVLERYAIKPELRQALREDDVAALAPFVNAYLLRFYFQVRQMPEPTFIARLREIDTADAPRKVSAHG